MRRDIQILAWLALGVLGAVGGWWAFPRAYPLFPDPWEISRQEAEAIALERLRDLAPLPADAYLVMEISTDSVLGHRLLEAMPELGEVSVRESRLARDLMVWRVTVYPPDANSRDWSHRAEVTPGGGVSGLRIMVPPEERLGAIDPGPARTRSDAFLVDQGFDLSRYEEPEVRSQQLQNRTDLTLRYRDRERLLGEEHPYGLEVAFAGERLSGYSRFYDDPERTEIQSGFRLPTMLNQAWVFVTLLLLPVVAVPFVVRYHAGEVGVRRSAQIAAVIGGLGLVMMLFCARTMGASWQIGVLTRPQVTWVVASQMLILFFFPMAVLAFLSWSVGESLCRERWGDKLAAFDAFFQGEWRNATFARAALRGTTTGVALIALLWLLAAALRPLGVWPSLTFLLGPWWESAAWFSVPLVAFAVAYALYTGLFGRLLLVSAACRALGRWPGAILAVAVTSVLFFPAMFVHPFAWNLGIWLVVPAVLTVLFLRYGIFTSLLASVTGIVVAGAIPFLSAEDPAMQLQASLALLVVALPMLVSLRSLASNREFVYRYEDVPPHVRRIAERERQRVELETARGIQSSILPDLPPQLHGVELAHAYLPATEVGGDFYDVLALEDGRLAVAIGDVAGHGVSSGLVMSMAKSALAIQVTFQPEVEAVFRTLNRMVFQSARRRLLTTLCYALVDPQARRLAYASAGHLFPYRVTAGGGVLALESVSYPLGVRGELTVRVRTAHLEEGDTLVLFSDGVVEAHAEGSDDLYGFDRFEASLRRHAGEGVRQIRDGVLADLDRFTGGSRREDDLTLLLLRVP